METGSEMPEKVRGVLEFGPSEIAVALHFVERIPDGQMQKDPAQADRPTVFTSMELDLLAYQFQRGCPPIKSGLPREETGLSKSASRRLFIRIPETFNYYSEGREESISISPNLIEAQVRLSWSDFGASKLRVWHCVITPAEGKHFDEYAILALIHLYDGRAESTGLKRKIEFRLDNDHAASITGADNLVEILKPKYLKVSTAGKDQLLMERDFVAGTIQIAPKALGGPFQLNLEKVWKARIDKKAGEGKGAFEELEKMYGEQNMSEAWKQLLAFAGIVVGIFDFKEVDLEEMLDTLAPTFSDEHIFLQMNRCSLIAFTPADRVIQDPNVSAQIGISPYLLFPHAAIIHNETLVHLAEAGLDSIHEQIQTAWRDPRLFVLMARLTRFLSGKRKLERESGAKQKMTGRSLNVGSSSLQELELELEKATRSLGELQLPNIFNYVTERTLFDKGMEMRGSLDKRKAVEAKRVDTKEQIELLWKLRNEWSQIWVAAILAAFTGVSAVMSNREWLESKLRFLFGNMDEAPPIALGLGVILFLGVVYFRGMGVKKQARDG
jgi:hypothetical protein